METSPSKLFVRMEKFVEKNGVAKLAFLLGLRDTGRVKNWIARKKISYEFEEQVKRALTAKVKIEAK